MLFEVGKGVERRLRVARAGQRAGKVAGLVAQLSRFGPKKRLDEPQERAPALHRPPKIVHCLGVGLCRILDGRPRLGKDVARHTAQRFPHRHARPQGGSLVHDKNIGHSTTTLRRKDRGRAFQALSRLLHTGRGARAGSRLAVSRWL
jgi:hypothetical protein